MSHSTSVPSVQVKVTLPLPLQKFLQQKAQSFGMNVSSYIKYLVLDDVRDMSLPTFTMSKTTEKTAVNALIELKQDQTKEIHDIKEFIDEL